MPTVRSIALDIEGLIGIRPGVYEKSSGFFITFTDVLTGPQRRSVIGYLSGLGIRYDLKIQTPASDAYHEKLILKSDTKLWNITINDSGTMGIAERT